MRGTDPSLHSAISQTTPKLLHSLLLFFPPSPPHPLSTLLPFSRITSYLKNILFLLFTCLSVSLVHMSFCFSCSHVFLFLLFTCLFVSLVYMSFCFSCSHVFLFFLFTCLSVSLVHMSFCFSCSHVFLFLSTSSLSSSLTIIYQAATLSYV
jgi:hypothetical protein